MHTEKDTVNPTNASSVSLFDMVDRFKCQWSLCDKIETFEEVVEVSVCLRLSEFYRPVLMDPYQVFSGLV